MPILSDTQFGRFRRKLAELSQRYDADNDVGPNSPMRYETKQLLDIVDDLIDILGNEPENSENQPPILSANRQAVKVVPMTLEQVLNELDGDVIEITTSLDEVNTKLGDFGLALDSVVINE